MAEALTLAEKGIHADAAGTVVGDKFYMPIGEAGFIKPFSGFLAGEELAYIKTFSFFPANPDRFDLPATSSLVLLFEAQSGVPVCVLEANWITGLKTGASTTLTAQWLARPEATKAAIFGAGFQGRMHLRGLTQRFALEQVWVLDVLPEIAERYAAELRPELDLAIDPVPLTDREKAVEEAEIIIMVTTANQPLIQHAWLQPGAFVAKLGSYQEVALDVVARADKLIVDNWAYVSPRVPELRQLIAQGRLKRENLYAEWPEIVAKRVPGRQTSEEVIVYIALGIWGEYAAILPEVYRQALDLGLGSRLVSSEAISSA